MFLNAGELMSTIEALKDTLRIKMVEELAELKEKASYLNLLKLFPLRGSEVCHWQTSNALDSHNAILSS